MGTVSRISNLDAVRGVAVLGILVVNALAYGWPMDAMMAMQKLPMAVDGILQGSDRIGAWAIEALFADKFRTLFCLLFGVSIYLVGGERSDKARGRKLLRRLGWLAVFGLIHGLAFWFGDILMLYAWTGLFVMLMRGLSGKVLLIVGGSITAALIFIQASLGLLMPVMPPEIAAAFEGHAEVTTASLLADVAKVRSGYGAAMMENLISWAMVQGMSLTIMAPAVFALMVLGMGLFKVGFFHGQLSNKIYAAIIAVGLSALALKGWAAWVEGGVSPELLPSRGLNMVGSSLAVLISLAYAAIIIKLPALFVWARPVGQMAFTTYLTQTLIMTTLFYMPWGPKWYGQMGPAALWGVIACVWVVQIVFTHLWLKAYRWGPFEWVWRSLTEGRKLSLSRAAA